MGSTAAPLGVGLVGCGGAAAAHVRDHYAVAPEHTRLVACADLDPAAARSFAQQHGIAAAASFTELLGRPDVDVVDVCTPTSTHVALSLAALRAGRHVVCEKPLASDPDEVVAVVGAAERAGRHVGVAHNYRWRPEYAEARSLLGDGPLGAPRFATVQVQVDWAAARGRPATDGADLLVDLAYHHVDLATWLVRSEVASVHATIGPSFAVLTMVMASGVVASLSVAGGARGSVATWGGAGLVEAEHGTVYLNQPHPFRLSVSSDAAGANGERHFPAAHYGPSGTAPFGPPLTEFFAAVREGRRPPVGAGDTYNVVATLHAARRSAQEGGPVAVPVAPRSTAGTGRAAHRPAGGSA